MPKVSPSVLIIRLDGIGDALALTPLLAALHARRITVDIVLQENNAGVFSARAARHVVCSAFALRCSSKENLTAIALLGRELRAQMYSHVLVATEDPAGYRLAHAVAAPVRIGFHNGWAKPLKRLWSRRLLTAAIYRHAGVDRSGAHECEVLYRLGASVIGHGKPTRDLNQLRPLVLDRDPVRDDRVGIQLTEKWQRLGIPNQDVTALIRHAAQRRKVRLFSSEAEGAYAARVAQAVAMSVEVFADVKEWEGAIGSVATLITPDCGAVQVAGMIGTPVVAIFPPAQHFAPHVARWAPWASLQRVLSAAGDWPIRATDGMEELLNGKPVT